MKILSILLNNKVRKKVFLFVLFILFLNLFPFVKILASAPRALEIVYPPLPGIPSPLKTTTIPLPEYFRYIYYFFIGISGLIALGVIIIAGINYLTSAGSPEKMKEGKDKIKAALLGLVILFFSWLILITINPQIVVFREPEDIPPVWPDLRSGVLLCKNRVDVLNFWTLRQQVELQPIDEQKDTVNQLTGILNTIKENCYWPAGKGQVQAEFEDEIQYTYLIPVAGKTQYGAILCEERDCREAKNKIIYGDGAGNARALNDPTEWKTPDTLGISTVVPFILDFNPKPSWYVELYKLTNSNIDDLNEWSQKYPGTTTNWTNGVMYEGWSGSGQSPAQEIGSLKVEGDMIIIFFKNYDEYQYWNLGAVTAIFTQSNRDLNQTPLLTWRTDCIEIREPDLPNRAYPCAAGIVIISAKTID